MPEVLENIVRRVEEIEESAHCQIDNVRCQIIVSFDKRPDVKVALLTPYAQMQVKKGFLDIDVFDDLLHSVKRIANR